MTCRSLLWIAAAAVSVGAATSTPSPAAAAPDAGWTITIDAPATGAVVESKHLTIHGTAAHETGIDTVTVTVLPQGLPPQCGPASGPAVSDGQSYVIELDVDCNGPHEIHVVADSNDDTATTEPHTIGVAERPPQPLPPTTDVTAEGGLRATWDPGHDPDTNGTILVVNYRQDHHEPGIDHATLPPTDRNAAVSIRTLRWGPDGPGTTSIPSPESNGTYIAPDPLIPDPPDEPPPSEPPPATPPAPPADGSSTITPSPNGDGSITPPPTTGAPSTTTVSAVPREAQPGTAATVASWPEPDRRAVSTTPAGGLVRTSDERTPARMAPFVLAMLAITIAAGIAWRSRRTASGSWAHLIPAIHRRPRHGALGDDLTLVAPAWTELGRGPDGMS